MKLPALKGVELPGKVLPFCIVSLDPDLKGGVKGHLPANESSKEGQHGS